MIDPRLEPILFPIPEAADVAIQRNLALRTPGGTELAFDVYLPRAETAPPIVLFNHGDGTPERMSDAKDWAQFVSWGRLMASSGLAAVTFNRRSTEGRTRTAEVEAEVKAVLEHLHQYASVYGVDGERIGVCAFSAGPPTVIPLLLQEQPEYVRGVVVYYGLLDSSADVVEGLQSTEGVAPMLIMRAGLDRPLFNDSIDRFLQAALARNLPVELFNHPRGQHAFDVRDDVPRTREAIAHTIDFFRWHLAAAE